MADAVPDAEPEVMPEPVAPSVALFGEEPEWPTLKGEAVPLAYAAIKCGSCPSTFETWAEWVEHCRHVHPSVAANLKG